MFVLMKEFTAAEWLIHNNEALRHKPVDSNIHSLLFPPMRQIVICE